MVKHTPNQTLYFNMGLTHSRSFTFFFGSSNSTKKQCEKARFESQVSVFCDRFTTFMVQQGFSDFVITKNKRNVIREIYQNFRSKNLKNLIKTAIDKNKESVRMLTYSQRGGLYQEKFVHLGFKEYQYRLFLRFILNEIFPITKEMDLTFENEKSYVIESYNNYIDKDIPLCKYYVRISWANVKTEPNHPLQNWSQCKTSEDVKVYATELSQQREILRQKVLKTCKENNIDVDDIDV